MASSSYLWHYTKFENLKKILETQYILPSECNERYDFLGLDNLSFKEACFTNIDFENNQIHKDKFKGCCIGFENEWVNDHKICPMIYCRRNGQLTDLLKKLLSNDEIDVHDRRLLQKFIKPYSDFGSEGYNPKDDEIVDKEHLRRYDEYEWRYIPEYENDVLKFNTKDIVCIYVDTIEHKIELQNEFPKYADKVEVMKNK